MKKLLTITAIVICHYISFGQKTEGYPSENPNSAVDWDTLSLKQVCAALQIPYDYNKRYAATILPLCKEGLVLFDENSNPYTKGTARDTSTVHGVPMYCFCYIGSVSQNEKLRRNLIENRDLIRNGKVIAGAAKRWKVVK